MRFYWTVKLRLFLIEDWCIYTIFSKKDPIFHPKKAQEDCMEISIGMSCVSCLVVLDNFSLDFLTPILEEIYQYVPCIMLVFINQVNTANI